MQEHERLGRSQTDQCFTDGQEQAVQAGDATLAGGDFDSLADAIMSRDRGRATGPEAAYLDATPACQIEDALEYRRTILADRQQIRRDLRKHGQRAHDFYS